jgi:manganese/zinc/iron transport system substrate-binding protein
VQIAAENLLSEVTGTIWYEETYMLRTSVALWLLICSTACAPGGSDPPDSIQGALQIVATTSIVADLVRNIGGEQIEVTALMGPGIDPHVYTPSAGDVRRLAAADAVFFNGLHLEGKMGEVLEEMGQQSVPTFAVAECVQPSQRLTAEGPGSVSDPHIWFDVLLWKVAASCARDALVSLDANAAAEYELNYQNYCSELDELESWVHAQVGAVPEDSRILVTAHDAFAYFGHAYCFEVLGLLGISTASEAGTGDVQELAELISNRRIPAIFVETSVSPRYVEALQEAVHHRGFAVAIGGSLYSDALGDPGSSAESYIGTVRANVETIVAALSGS